MGAKKKGKAEGGIVVRSVIALEHGFSIMELTVVMVVIGILIGTGVIGYFATMRQSDVKGSAEMVKEAISVVQGMANRGVSHNGERDRYRLEFHSNAAVPPNAYKIQKQEYNGAAWGAWVDVEPEQGTYMKLVSNVWVQPSSSSDLRISFPVTAAETFYDINFTSMGSIVKTTSSNPSEATSVTVTSVSESKSIVITVTEFGEVTYVE